MLLAPGGRELISHFDDAFLLAAYLVASNS